MTRLPVPSTPTGTLAERVQHALGHTAASAAPSAQERQSKCLLLDVSGSMEEEVESGRRKIDALRDLAARFPLVQKFQFSTRCRRLLGAPSEPGGSTAMHRGFATVRAAGVVDVVLVTDGLPDDEDLALRCAHGLHIEIFYVGPTPRPDFLDRLARLTGGQAQSASLRRTEAKQLTAKIAGLLEGGK